MIEDYLAAERQESQHRPTALVLTKGRPARPPDGGRSRCRICAAGFQHHQARPRVALSAARVVAGSAVLGGPSLPEERPATARGLDGPLTWLAAALQAQDEARLEPLDALAPPTWLLERGCHGLRPATSNAPAAATHRRRLGELRPAYATRAPIRQDRGGGVSRDRLVRLRRLGRTISAGLRGRSSSGSRRRKERWEGHQFWHPTRNLLRPTAAHKAEHLRQLDAAATATARTNASRNCSSKRWTKTPIRKRCGSSFDFRGDARVRHRRRFATAARQREGTPRRGARTQG